ncbi:outer membrane protein [Hirschia maritima]|uniref:outer membrane protein n=1 Tax=Hirschia maritima TaxID=1121961 RepID=UPI00036711B1|nr:outer membrane beta-barrel protein [Hirschia maritima]
MKTNFLKMSAICAATVAFAGQAIADSGFYISGGLNSTSLTHDVSRNTGSNLPNTGASGGPSATTTDRDTGASVYIAGGYRFDIFEDSYLEVEAFYADESAETQNLNGVLVSELELSNSYGLDLHLGQQITEKFSIYGLVGVTQYEGDANQFYTFAPPVSAVEFEETAFVYGAGVELALTDKLSTFGEVRLSNDVDFDTPVDQGGIRAENNLEFTTIRSGLKFKF